MNISNELRVGIMFLAGLIILILLIMSLTRGFQRRNTYTFSIRFQQAQGIQEGADVRVAGVKVGQVSSVSLDPETQRALVSVLVDKRVRLYDNYIYTIGVGGLVGERYIEIIPRPKKGNLVKSGDEVAGTTSADFNQLIADATTVVNEFSKTVDSINAIVGDEETQQNIKQTAHNLQVATATSAQLTATLNDMIMRNQGAIDVIVLDLQVVAGDLRRVSETLTPQLERTQLFANLDEASASALRITRRLERLTVAVDTIIDDEALAAALRDTLVCLKKTCADLEQTMANVREASEPLPEITTNLAKASADLPEITRPFKEIAPETAENVLRISRSLRQTSESVGGIAQGVIKAGAALGALTMEPEARVTFLTEGEQSARSDVNLNLRGQSTMFRLGVADIGNDSSYNLQFGNKLDENLWFRYGIVQSRFGLGLDYQPNENFYITGEAFDPDRFRANLLLDYRLKQLGTGWWLSSGWYDLFDQEKFGVGLTYRP